MLCLNWDSNTDPKAAAKTQLITILTYKVAIIKLSIIRGTLHVQDVQWARIEFFLIKYI